LTIGGCPGIAHPESEMTYCLENHTTTSMLVIVNIIGLVSERSKRVKGPSGGHGGALLYPLYPLLERIERWLCRVS